MGSQNSDPTEQSQGLPTPATGCQQGRMRTLDFCPRLACQGSTLPSRPHPARGVSEKAN